MIPRRVIRRRVIVSFAGQAIDDRPGGLAVEARGCQPSERGRAFPTTTRAHPARGRGQASLKGELAPVTQAPDRGTFRCVSLCLGHPSVGRVAEMHPTQLRDSNLDCGIIAGIGERVGSRVGLGVAVAEDLQEVDDVGLLLGC